MSKLFVTKEVRKLQKVIIKTAWLLAAQLLQVARMGQ